MPKVKTKSIADAATIGSAIVAALKARNVPAKYEPTGTSEHRGYVRCGGTALEITGRPQFTGNYLGGKRVETWAYTVLVGYGTLNSPRKRFPPRKNGHDFDAIALAAISAIEAEDRARKYRNERKAANERMEQIRLQMIADYALDDLAAWMFVDDGKLRIDACHLTPKEATAIMRAWKGAKEP